MRRKWCDKCGHIKPVDQFHKSLTKWGERRSTCATCYNVGRLNARGARIAGSPTELYQRLLRQQRGRCAICRTRDPGLFDRRRKCFCFDHDHRTGKIRGLLCTGCNRAIGLLRDNPALIRKALAYLKG